MPSWDRPIWQLCWLWWLLFRISSRLLSWSLPLWLFGHRGRRLCCGLRFSWGLFLLPMGIWWLSTHRACFFGPWLILGILVPLVFSLSVVSWMLFGQIFCAVLLASFSFSLWLLLCHQKIQISWRGYFSVSAGSMHVFLVLLFFRCFLSHSFSYCHYRFILSFI